MKKRILLVAGGGTLGTYTAQELLRLGHYVDVICVEEKKSDHERLTYYRFFYHRRDFGAAPSCTYL